MPAKIAVDEYNGRLTIVIPWRRFVPGLVTWTLLGFFACLGFGGIGAGLIIDKRETAPIGGIAFCALAVAIIGYILLAYWFNKTTVEVTRNSVAGEHGPLPFPRSRRFAIGRQEIDQVYVQTTNEVTQHGSIRISYQMCALLNSGNRVRLFDCGCEMGRTTDEPKAAAKRLESQIETFLGIEDRDVDDAEVIVGVPHSYTPG